MRIRTGMASLVAAIVLAGMAGRACADGDKVLLRLHLKAGQKFGLKQTEISRIGVTYSTDGQYMSINSTEAYGFMFHVNSVDADGTAHMDAILKSVNVTISVPGDVLTYDSSNSSSKNPLLASVYGPLIGRKNAIVLSPEGKVSGLPTDGTLSYRAMKFFFENNYSPTPVAIGERWSYVENDSWLPYIATMYMKITDRSGGMSSVKVYADVKPKPQDSTRTYGGMTTKMLISGTLQGNMVIDEATGLMAGGSLNGQLTGDCEVVTGSKRNRGQVNVAYSSTTEKYFAYDDY